MELIIVDNNSNQETQDIVKSYSQHKNVKIILNKKNYGFAKGNNIGLKKATGDYLILLNNDILVTPGWMNRLVFHCQKQNVGLVGPVTNSIGNEAKIDIIYDPKNTKDLETKAKIYTTSHWGETLNLRNLAAFCWIMSRETYKKIGDLDEKFGRGMFEDDDYCIRVKQAGLDILCADDVFIHHYGGASFKKIQTEEYQKLFNDNKKIFETKWNTTWIPHVYRKQKV
jgi:GT2 family glycosyltransferase